ncbi:MAG: protein arginine kinase [Syntrophomonadaceae bacterium]|nr:protein arginine kinase [Syntrophomonadaceae bacterium]MDD4550499.1 protein arginine kinase [Syntrophomonadaceae bacterium]
MDLLNSHYVRWMAAQEGPESDIVISSRVRLARNLRLIPFPHLLDNKNGQKCLDNIKQAWQKSTDTELKGMDLITFNQTPALDRQILLEKHLISPQHAGSDDAFRGLLANKDGSLAIMINEEDHLRIQCFLPGLQMAECLRHAQVIDDDLEHNLNFAFDEQRGYLTSCPTNVGTGMRASVMLHLPAITITGQTKRIFENINHFGMTVRGLYGEGTEVIGNLYQVSNQITLGQSEEDIINNLTIITAQIIDQERLVRESLQKKMKYQLEDRVGRAYGILTNSRVITSNEALSLLSEVRLGVDMGIIKDIKPFAINELIVALRPAHLQKKAGKEMDAFNRDIKRASVIQEKLLSSL